MHETVKVIGANIEQSGLLDDLQYSITAKEKEMEAIKESLYSWYDDLWLSLVQERFRRIPHL
jgi:hypothetical protein